MIQLFLLEKLNVLVTKNAKLDASSGAVIMAIGIFLIGGIKEFPLIHLHASKYMAITLVMIWIFIIYSYIKVLVAGLFRRYYLYHRVNSFAIGSWVAASSIIVMVVLKHFPQYHDIVKVVAMIDSILWSLFFYICLYCFKVIIQQGLYNRIHGVILLSTVSTQSIVILLSNAFPSSIPIYI